jgi:hypothetical protein
MIWVHIALFSFLSLRDAVQCCQMDIVYIRTVSVCSFKDSEFGVSARSGRKLKRLHFYFFTSEIKLTHLAILTKTDKLAVLDR